MGKKMDNSITDEVLQVARNECAELGRELTPAEARKWMEFSLSATRYTYEKSTGTTLNLTDLELAKLLGIYHTVRDIWENNVVLV